MKLIGFNFNKISIEKLKQFGKELKIDTKIDIKSIQFVKSDLLKTKEELLGVEFKYFINYNPDVAKLELTGNILISEDSKKVKEILKEWKDKKISDDFRIFVFNIILRKSNIKALQLEEELNLPVHVPLPSLNQTQHSEKK